MDTYVILRRTAGARPRSWRRRRPGRQPRASTMPDDIRWIRSYVLEEGNGVGTVCIYQASSPEAIREHARRLTCRSTRSSRVADTVIVRPDPAPVAV